MLGGAEPGYVNRFCYLGVVLPVNLRSYRNHVEKRVGNALAEARSIAGPQKLSLETPLALFPIKVAPTATYAIQLVWDRLA